MGEFRRNSWADWAETGGRFQPKRAIVLDTNVISELMRREPDATVFAWVDRQPRGQLYTTTIVQAEILYGIASLAAGRQKDSLTAHAQALFDEELAGRVLPFTSDAAQTFARLAAQRRREGRSIARHRALIAACALSVGAAVATRDLRGFEDSGLTVINPWEG